MFIVPDGWMDEDANWYGSRPRPRPHCARRGSSSPRKRHSSPLFSAHVCCGHGRPSQLLLSSCWAYVDVAWYTHMYQRPIVRTFNARPFRCHAATCRSHACSSINWYTSQRRRRFEAGKVTAGMSECNGSLLLGFGLASPAGTLTRKPAIITGPYDLTGASLGTCYIDEIFPSLSVQSPCPV